MERNGNHHRSSNNGIDNGTHAGASGLLKSVDNDDDIKWEQNYKRIEKLKPLFRHHLPASKTQVAKVFGICQGTIPLPAVEDYEEYEEYGKNYVGPLVLAKKVPLEKFQEWLRQEWGLHKSVRLVTGTVYVPQACAYDHGILRQCLGDSELFPILSRHNATRLGVGSGAHGNQNPDVSWFRHDEMSSQSRVIFEVGISQSLPDLRRRAYELCAATGTWTDLQYVVLIRRYQHRLYVEIWRRVAGTPGAAEPEFSNDQRPPQQLNIQGTMQFVANAQASNPGAGWIDALTWQQFPPSGRTSCDIPAGNEVLVGGPAITLNARALLDECKFEDI